MTDTPDRPETTAEDDDEMLSCEGCGARHPIEQMHSTIDGCDICPKCWAEWKADVTACAHEWSAEPAHDMHGNPARYCTRCSVVETLQDA